MRHPNDGCALVLVYENGRRTALLSHAHDGGEAYMGPLIRKAVQYAKVQYRSGDITQILEAEEAMTLITIASPMAYLRKLCVRHVYYVKADWDCDETRKHYCVYARHLCGAEVLGDADVPEFAEAVTRNRVQKLL